MLSGEMGGGEGRGKVLIVGPMARNRAIHNDRVAILLLPKSEASNGREKMFLHEYLPTIQFSFSGIDCTVCIDSLCVCVCVSSGRSWWRGGRECSSGGSGRSSGEREEKICRHLRGLLCSCVFTVTV